MKIVCPACDATYEVPEAVVTSRRVVRCARCGAEWHPGGEPAAEPAVASPGPAPEPVPPPPPPSEPAPPEAAPAAQGEPAIHADTPAGIPLAAEAVPAEAGGAVPHRPAASGQAAPPPVSAAAIDANVARLATRVPAIQREPRAPVAAWIVSGILLAGFVLAMLMFRQPIMKSWPPSTRLYAALGLYRP